MSFLWILGAGWVQCADVPVYAMMNLHNGNSTPCRRFVAGGWWLVAGGWWLATGSFKKIGGILRHILRRYVVLYEQGCGLRSYLLNQLLPTFIMYVGIYNLGKQKKQPILQVLHKPSFLRYMHVIGMSFSFVYIESFTWP